MAFTESSFIIKNDGTLWGCGWNGSGTLGLGNTSSISQFTKITTNTDDIKSIHGGYDYAIMLKNDGTLWGCGTNSGQLGLGDNSNRYIFTQIINNVKSVYCGYMHIIILKNDSTLWGCGNNTYGQLGLGDKSNRNIFTQITTNADNIKSVYCGERHTLISKNDDTLWVCGDNTYGQLGLGDKSVRTTFTKIIANVNDIKSVYCGSNCTLILQNDDTLWGCGSNGGGKLGLESQSGSTTFTIINTNPGNVKSVYCGNDHTLILQNDGTLWGCGANGYGQLGLGDTNNRKIFTKIISDVKSAYCGDDYTLILKNDGTLWGCGDNGYGQLGLGDGTNRYTFTQITTNVDNVKKFANDYPSPPSVIKIYDTNIGYVETLDTNNFRNIPVNKFEKIKVLYAKPDNTILNCLISFDQKQTWKTFDGSTWITVSDTSGTNIIVNCMGIETLNSLSKDELIQGGFTGSLDFKCVMKTNNVNKTPSITKIYIEYK